MNDELITALCKKMSKEQKAFRDWLLTQTQEEVLNHACGYAIREGIVSIVAEEMLAPAQAGSLLRLRNPLAEVFLHWQNHQTGYLEGMRDAVNRCVNFTSRSQRSQMQRRER